MCRASRVEAKEWLRTLRRLVVSGGYVTGAGGGFTSAVWRLNLGELRWERMPDLGCGRIEHACCAVRGGVVVLGWKSSFDDVLATVVLRLSDSEAEELTFTDLPPLACGPRSSSTALPVDESESVEGLVLLLGGYGEHYASLGVAARVVKVDLATGACTPQPPLLYD